MLDLKHGGHVVVEEGEGAASAAKRGDVTLTRGLPVETTPFDYLFPKLKDKPGSHLPGDKVKVSDDLDALGKAMTDPSTLFDSNSTIPAVYIYWGQFIDHDMTANTDSDFTTIDIRKVRETGPVPPDTVTKTLRNLRRPALDLDSVYGDGPSFLNPVKNDRGFYDGPFFRIGTNHPNPDPKGVADKIPPVDDLARDLPRIGPLLDAGIITELDLPESLRKDPSLRTRALIGDLRNDENLIVAQFHLAFLRFHNNVVKKLSAPQGQGLLDGLLNLIGDLLGGGNKQAQRFLAARQLTRWHYQWLVVNDFLKTVTVGGTVEKILADGLKFYKPLENGKLYMPLEFSAAAYRFGHSMVRAGYDFNRDFGVRTDGQGPGRASFEQLFEFTGNGHRLDPNDPTKSTPSFLGGFPALPFNWIIEWDRFTIKGDTFTPHFGKSIDTHLSAGTVDGQNVLAVLNMVNEGTEIQDNNIRVLLRHLARRNLLRGYLLSIPTGQSVAAEMGVAPLTETELRQNNSQQLNDALDQGGFIQNTPLWFYVLKEAEVRANGNSLGEVGSRIVAETIIGVMRHDKSSYLNVPSGWNPSKGVKLDNGQPILTIRDFLSFTGVPA